MLMHETRRVDGGYHSQRATKHAVWVEVVGTFYVVLQVRQVDLCTRQLGGGGGGYSTPPLRGTINIILLLSVSVRMYVRFGSCCDPNFRFCASRSSRTQGVFLSEATVVSTEVS